MEKIPKRGELQENFHVIHKVPAGDGPYVRAKHAQLIDKDPEAAIVLFWQAINVGDRVESALKDMAVVMKQQNRAEEAIEAIKSFRDRCSKQAQESLDNVLIDLYKKCGRIDDQINLLKQKLKMIYLGEVFNGKPTKVARSHGKKFQVSIKQETARVLGNLGWAYMQQMNFFAAEVVYRKAQQIEPDSNKAGNLALCLIKQERKEEAKSILESIRNGEFEGSDDWKLMIRIEQLLYEIETTETSKTHSFSDPFTLDQEKPDIHGFNLSINKWSPSGSRRLPIFEKISSFRDQIAC